MSEPPRVRPSLARPASVREGQSDDVEVIVALWIDLIGYHRSLDPDYPVLPSLRETLRAEVRRGLDSVDCRVLLAEPRAGFAFTQVESAPRVASVGWIHELWVDPESRRVGTGRALVAAADGFFEERGTRRVSVRVEGLNREGLLFWERLGFVERARILER